MRRFGFLPILAVLSILAVVGAPEQARSHVLGSTVDELLALDVRPIAIAHRGFGENSDEDPSRPVEETLSAVRRGFRAGASVVEVDVQRTADGEIVAYHDDFLPDYTCIHRLTLGGLRARLPHVATLHAILLQARSFNQPRGPLRGLVIVEMKAPSPLCDPDDTQERAIVASVAAVIRRVDMTDQVILTSFSPVLLFLARAHIPEVVRSLTIDGLQFLGPDEIAAVVRARLGDLSVTPIDKQPDFGLRWAEIGSILRLPGYRSVQEMIATAALVDARLVEADLILLGSLGAPLVDLLHSVGLKVLGYTVDDAAEWQLLESLGVDGIYTNDVPLGVELEAAIPSLDRLRRANLRRPRPAESLERRAG
jgi:glycerophosphoryl diester phosphodiesterase